MMVGCGTCQQNHPTAKHDVVQAAVAAQAVALEHTRATVAGGPCEVCGKDHPTYECCEKCNYGTHTCHFCGDPLGHTEVSACYILLKDEENDPAGWTMGPVAGPTG